MRVAIGVPPLWCSLPDMRPTDAIALLIHGITRAGTAGDHKSLLANERTSATRQGRGKPSPYYTRVGRLARPSIVGAIPCGRSVYGHHRVVLAFASKGLYGRPVVGV